MKKNQKIIKPKKTQLGSKTLPAIKSRIAQICLTVPDDLMYNEVLKLILKTTASKYGVFGYLDDNGALVVPSMTRHIWDMCQVPEKTIVFPRETWGDSIWPRAIKQKKTLYSNETSSRVPVGHVKIRRNISLPILYHGQAIGLFQVANKKSDYDENDILILEDIADYIAPVFNARLQRDAQEKLRRSAEERVRHLNLVLRSIRDVNQLITRETDRAKLIQGACENLIANRGYFSAWIALFNEGGGLLSTAEAGMGDAFLPMAELLKRSELPHCARESMKTQSIITIKDVYSECIDCPVAKNHKDRGAICVRLKSGEKVYGVLSISVPIDLVTDKEEQSLFNEVAGDIAFALHNIEIGEGSKQAKEALMESEERYRRTIMDLTLGFYSVTLDGTLLDHNKEFNRILGFEIEENLAGIRLPDFWQDPEARKAYLKELQEHGIIKNYPIPTKKRNGEHVFIEANTRLVQDKQGNQTHIEGTFIDVTDRRRAEEALREANENLELRVLERTMEMERSKQLLDETGRLARVGGWEIDLKKNALTWTDSVYQIHEVDPEYKPTVETAINFYAPEAVPVISMAVQRAIDQGQPFDVELPLITAKGNRILVRALGQAHRDNGEIVRISGIFHDITERKHAEEELARRAEELAVANRELEAFSYSVSHDLRAPLRAIDGFSKVLLDNYSARLDDEGQRYLNIIRNNTQDMGKLIDDLLSFSRIGKQEMVLSSVDMDHSARETYEMIIREYPGRIIKFIMGTPPSASGDASMIKIVLNNLLSNAVKFTGSKAEAVIEFGGKQENDENIYYIKDNGVGFNMKYVDKLFGVFQRLHSRGEFEGTGVGLALVQRIIHRHGGRVWAEGAINEGATFYFTLPLKGGKK